MKSITEAFKPSYVRAKAHVIQVNAETVHKFIYRVNALCTHCVQKILVI